MFYKVPVYIISSISTTMWYKHKIHNDIYAAYIHKNKVQFSSSRYIIFKNKMMFLSEIL